MDATVTLFLNEILNLICYVFFNKRISDQQFGFMPGRSSTDAIFALRQLMEKSREGHCVFIDLEKAYDRVLREELWNCLHLKEVEEKYIRLIMNMYRESSTRVRCAAGTTEEFSDSRTALRIGA